MFRVVIRLQFWVFFFELSFAFQVFTSMVVGIVSVLHDQGMHILANMDDFFLCAPTKILCNTLRETAIEVFKDFEFLINWEKSDLFSK